MIFGMTAFTFVHVVISLIAIASGAVAAAGLLTRRRLDGWTAIFLLTAVATSVTGFLFPFVRLLPSHIVGAISLVVLALAIYARYVGRMQRGWRATYAVTAVLALYLNVFVLVVQLFLKVPALNALAPTQAEPPFLVAQSAVLALFVAIAVGAVLRFRPAAIQAA